jgi:HEAT repeat protein
MSNTITRTLAIAILLSAGIGAPALVSASSDKDMAPNDKELNQLYWQAHAELKNNDLSAALKDFRDLEKRLATGKPNTADAAIYWQAYTLMQAKRSTEAQAAVERLHRDFPQSRWGKDADALLRQVKPVIAGDTGGADDELAEIAVEGLMNAPPERALPLLKKVLQSQRSDKVKKRALFVLSQIDSDEAINAVVDLAKNSTDRGLRNEAIRMLGVSGEARAIVRLRELYATSKDPSEKREIIQAWLVADRVDLILAQAKDETDKSVRAAAINALGALDAHNELKQLFDTSKDISEQKEIIQALGVAGDVKSLAAIAESASEDPVRAAAIQSLGIAGNEGGSDALLRLYSKYGQTPALRDAILQGLMIAGNSKGMLKLYREAKSTEEKKALLRTISMMDEGDMIDLIEAELNK